MSKLILKILIICTLALFSSLAQAASLETLAKGGAGGWLNTQRPLTVEDMQGRLVLLDFWTYGCVNCMQITPDLEHLEKTFGDRLLIIGVHSAKFKGEKDSRRILAAAQRFGLTHPVINDSDFAIWKSYDVNAWPTLVLLGPDGTEISRYAGEGHRDALEKDISGAIDGIDSAALKPLPGAAKSKKEESVLWFPTRLTKIDRLFYVTDAGHNRILGFNPSGNIKVTIGSGEKGFKDGGFEDTTFNNPRGLVAVGDKLYVADTDNHALREIDLTGGTVTTVAGNGQRGHGYDVKDAPGKEIELASPWDVDVMEDGKTLVIAMAGLHQLWTYDTEKGTVSVLAGSGYEKITDGPAADAALAQPSGVSVTGDVVYFVDAESSSLRKYEDGEVRTLIGTGLFDFGFEDGAQPHARLQHPQGVYATPQKIWVADTYNNAIRVYGPSADLLTTVKILGGTLNEPGDVLISGRTAYIADTGNHAIKTVDLVTGQMSSLAVKP